MAPRRIGLLFAIVLLALPTESAAQILFWPTQLEFGSLQTPDFGQTESVAVVDVNGDQKPDLIAISGPKDSPGAVAVLLGDDERMFGDPAFYPVGSEPKSIAVGHLNNDQVPDLAVANSGTGDVAVLLGIGDGTFGEATFFNAGLHPSSLAIADLNADQLLDIVVANGGSNNVTVLRGIGGGGFVGIGNYPAGVQPSTVAIGDLDGDLVPDVAVANFVSDTVAVLRGVGDCTLEAAGSYPVGRGPISVAIGDMTNDQIPDLVVANYSSQNVAVLPGLGNGAFGGARFFLAGGQSLSAAIADLNHDEALDVVVTTDGQGISVLLGIGNGALVFFHSYPGSGHGVAVDDLSGDHVPDLAIASFDRVVVLLGFGDGTFAEPRRYDVGGASGGTRTLAVGDLNGDQVPDIAVGTISGQGNIAVLLGNGDGEFQFGGFYGDDLYTPQGLALGDWNGDEVLDLAFSKAYVDSIAVYLGVGDGTFTVAGHFGTGTNPSVLTAGDLNGDEILDLVANAEGSVAVSLGVGDGTFGTASFLPTGQQSILAMSDFNGDEVPDLAIVSQFQPGVDRLHILLGVGDGTFDSAGDYAVDSGAVKVVAGDLNGNGVTDLVVVNGQYNEFVAFMGQGDGTFAPPAHVPVGSSLYDAVIADVSGDKIADVALTGGANMALVLGSGDGSFGPPMLYQAASSYSATLIDADFNRDGLLDLAFAGGAISVLFGYRAPSLATPATLIFPTVTVGDEVAVDLAVTNNGRARAPITNITFSSPAMTANVAFPLYIDPGATVTFPIRLAPREAMAAQGELHLHTIAAPASDVLVECDVRTLTVSSRRDPPDERVEEGQELRVIVTPDPQVNVERGALHYSIGEVGGQFVVPLSPGSEGWEAIIPTQHVTEDGLAYYIEVENSGVIGLDPPGAPDSTYAVGARFVSFPLPGDGQRFLEGRPIQIITNFTSIAGGTLYYRRAAEDSYRSVPIDTQQPIPVATIPDSVVGPRGIEYWMEVERGGDRQTDPPGWTGGPGEWPRTIRITVEGLGEEHDSPGDGVYRMVSVPLDFGHDVTLEDILSDQPAFGPYDPLQWRSFRYAEAESAQRYVELSEDAFPDAHRVIPGRAFWLASREAGRIETAPIVGTSIPSDDVFAVTVDPGWNQIASPFLFPVDWYSFGVVLPQEVIPMDEALARGVLEPPIAWRNGGYADSVQVLDPFDGYWVKNLADTTITLLVPPRQAGGTPREDAERAAGWKIAIQAAAGAADHAVAGVSPDALNAWDVNDRSEPPMAPGEAIALYFPHAEWEQHPGAYTADIRGAFGPLAAERDVASLLPHAEAWGHAWRFDVAKSRARVEEVQLEFAGLEDVPKEADVFLLDRRLGIARDLRASGRYSFHLGTQPATASEESARFVLVVGSAEFRDAALGGLPTPPARTALHPSHPNPFNPATLIRFDIASAGQVTLGIYDVRGALVKVLAQGRREPGRYEITWNGEDQGGNRVASGVYFCRLTSEHFSEARKLLMLR